MTVKVWAVGILMQAAVILAGAAQAEDDIGFSDQQTKRAVDIFNHGVAECEPLDEVHRVDCLRVTYSQTVRVISKASVYWEAEVALTRVNRGLYSFVRKNTDGEVDKVRANGGRIKAITQASLPEARALYQEGVDRAVAVLRSGDGVELTYFAPIADAVEASKSLLK